jgi:outer membrane protein assembly factor BamB
MLSLPPCVWLQADGNLVLVNVGNGKLIWQTGVTNPNPGYCNVQVDSNFVCIGANGASYWASGGRLTAFETY